MCGICGIIDPVNKVNPDLLARMTQIMVHRGPDAGGTWINEDRTVGFGNRRLAIIDLDPRSNMPFQSDDGSLVITYNGEIFNFADVRSVLESKGHRFRTHSDTEVILHAYQEWGLDCIEQFRGMFAWALYDRTRRRVWLVRDRLGIKPLLYYHRDATFAFASEPQQFSASGGFDCELDLTALYDCLVYLYIPAPKTAFKHLRKLEAGHWLLYEDGKVTIRRYWDVPVFGEHVIDEQTAVQRLSERIDEAVKLRLVSDVPVGSLLSGGLDSSCVTWHAQQNHTGPLHTFSIGFAEAENNELDYANAVAKLVGSHHISRIYKLNAARGDTHKLMLLYGEPHGDSSIFPTAVVCAMAREHVTVALSGDGGDELFWGYTRYLEYADFNARRLPLRSAGGRMIRAAMPLLARGRYRLLRYCLDEFDLWTVLQDGFLPHDLGKLLSPDVIDAVRGTDPYWSYRKHWRSELPLATRLQYLDLKTYLADDILVKVDRASMSVSLEARVPLLDHKLVEEVFSWPDNIRSDGRTLKDLFKKSLAEVLPPAILQKRKQGFSIPWKRWISDWSEFHDLRGDGRFYRKDVRLPEHYTAMMLQLWLNERNGI
ncbi:asparagine synthase (glutamine-hydrolyzing) [candidate division KSB1 bacterium]|nr:asparagine synthase (glutamine-hydrolyzing) [candidate division KSB1 bacterium]